MMLPCVGREHYRLSVTDGCRGLGGDQDSMAQRVIDTRSIQLTLQKN